MSRPLSLFALGNAWQSAQQCAQLKFHQRHYTNTHTPDPASKSTTNPSDCISQMYPDVSKEGKVGWGRGCVTNLLPTVIPNIAQIQCNIMAICSHHIFNTLTLYGVPCINICNTNNKNKNTSKLNNNLR